MVIKMKEKRSKKSWEISDEFWEAIKDMVPKRKRIARKKYKRKPGAGRKPLESRKVLAGIFYVLRTGCQWKALPKEYGAASSIHQYFMEWTEAGFFDEIWRAGLQKYDELEGIGWEWQSIDGCMVKAPLAREAVGHNPTDRGKKRE
jgi:putative transposase